MATRTQTTQEPTRRALVAMLGIAPASFVALRVAPLSNVEKLQQLIEARGITRIHFTWGPKAVEMSIEERAGAALEMLNTPKARQVHLDFGDSNRLDDPPMTGRTQVNLREFVKRFE